VRLPPAIQAVVWNLRICAESQKVLKPSTSTSASMYARALAFKAKSTQFFACVNNEGFFVDIGVVLDEFPGFDSL